MILKLLRNFLNKRTLRRHGIKLSVSIDEIKGHKTLSLEGFVSIGKVAVGFEDLSVGAYTYIRSGSELLNVSKIGRFCSIGNNVVIGQDRAAHPVDWITTHPFAQSLTSLEYKPVVLPVSIGHDVWVGRDAMVLEGVSIGTGAIIAARSLVTKDVPPYAIVGGVPAIIIRYRHPPEVVERLLESSWWLFSVNELKKMPLNCPESFIKSINNVCSEELYSKFVLRDCRVVSFGLERPI